MIQEIQQEIIEITLLITRTKHQTQQEETLTTLTIQGIHPDILETTLLITVI